MVTYRRHDVDRLYRDLPDAASVWLTQPSYDSQPHERRPVDELPGHVTDYLQLTEALERLKRTQRVVYKAVVLGIVRVWMNGQWQDVKTKPMTYEQAAAYLDMSEQAINHALRRARDTLARILSDRQENAA